MDSTGAVALSSYFIVAAGNCDRRPFSTIITMHDRLNLTTLLLCSTTVSAQETSTALTGIQSVLSTVTIGGATGGVIVLATVTGSILWYQKRKRNRHPTKGRPTYKLP